MKYSYNLLKELVDLKGLGPQEVAQGLDAKSFEVEAIENQKNFGISDWVLEIETGKTNRIDALGHLGIAREISAIFGRRMKSHYFLGLQKSQKRGQISLVVNSKLCSRYAAWRFCDVKVDSSPLWLKSRLLTCGFEPINNIVDLTNYIMLLTGQPLHAFDAKKISGKTIIVRAAKTGEKILTLDKEEINLNPSDIVIADEKGPIALAGIKGGLETSITPQTTEVILESANFDPIRIRRTSWRTGLRTESAHRFEKSLPREFVEAGLNFALKLFGEVAYAKACDFAIKDFHHPKEKKILFENFFSKQVLGYEISSSRIKKILSSLGFDVTKVGKKLLVKIPFFRSDVTRKEDLVKEIGRLNGYEKIPEKRPLLGTLAGNNQLLKLRYYLNLLLLGLGFNEIYNYSFYSSKMASRFRLPFKNHFEVLNPLSSDQELLRISLLPNFRKTLEQNFRYEKNYLAFEFGNVYFKHLTKNFHDSPRLAIGYISRKTPKEVFLDLKGRTEALFSKMHLSLKFSTAKKWLDNKNHPAFCAKNGEVLAYFLLGSSENSNYALAEINLWTLQTAIPSEQKFREFSRMPEKTVDLAIIVDKKISWQDVEKTLSCEPSISRVCLFDVYEGPQIPAGKKSLAFNLAFQEMKKTLSQAEVDAKLKTILENLKKKLKVQLR